VHLAEIGYPVIADDCYEAHGRLKPPPELRKTPSLPSYVESDDEEIDELDEDQIDDVEIDLAINDNALMSRHALHASQLGFQHPILNEWMTFTAPLPDDMQRALDYLHS
jgi:23S rRNA-/tRNA-specific pseudouridylate synthase